MEASTVSSMTQWWILAGCAILGGILAAWPTFMTAISVCGISGCTGGGFGRAVEPEGTRWFMLISAILFVAPFVVAALIVRTRRIVLASIVIALLAHPLAGLVAGARPDGCPVRAACQSGNA